MPRVGHPRGLGVVANIEGVDSAALDAMLRTGVQRVSGQLEKSREFSKLPAHPTTQAACCRHFQAAWLSLCRTFLTPILTPSCNSLATFCAATSCRLEIRLW